MTRTKIVALPILMILLSLVTPASNAQNRFLDLGGVVISISDSRTAQAFHIVDQMSQWDSGVHHGYVRRANRALKLSQEDQKLRQKHAELRRARGWGNGFEQAFYVDESIEVAAQRAVETNLFRRTKQLPKKWSCCTLCRSCRTYSNEALRRLLHLRRA